MSTDIRNSPTDKIVLYPEDDGGARLERWTPVDGFRTIRLTKAEAVTIRDALGQFSNVQTPDEAAFRFPLGAKRAILLPDEPGSLGHELNENEERQV